jgi:hypothetical protein
MKSVAVLAIAFELATTLAGCDRPPLRVSEQGRSITIDMQSLGEYPSKVIRIRLVEVSRNEIVWEVEGHDDPQIGRVQLKVGENPVEIDDVRHGGYDVVVPAGGSRFTLAPASRYRVEVWSNEGSKHVAEFMTPN